VYDKGNYDKFREMLDSVKWSHILNNKNCNDCWDIFKQIMDEGIKNYIPKCKINLDKPGKPLWMCDSALAKVRKKTQAYQRYLDTLEGKDFYYMLEPETRQNGNVARLRKSLREG
jgi:hypothetical protein